MWGAPVPVTVLRPTAASPAPHWHVASCLYTSRQGVDHHVVTPACKGCTTSTEDVVLGTAKYLLEAHAPTAHLPPTFNLVCHAYGCQATAPCSAASHAPATIAPHSSPWPFLRTPAPAGLLSPMPASSDVMSDLFVCFFFQSTHDIAVPAARSAASQPPPPLPAPATVKQPAVAHDMTPHLQSLPSLLCCCMARCAPVLLSIRLCCCTLHGNKLHPARQDSWSLACYRA